MESFEVKSTAITNDYKRNMIIFVMLSVIYTIVSSVILFKYGLWVFVAVACVAMPLFYFLHKWAFTISGYCPYCSRPVTTATQDSILECSACSGSIIVRDGRLWQRIAGTSQSEALKLPPGMSIDEFIEWKQKYKKQAWLIGGFILLVIVVFYSFSMWIKGEDIPLEIKTMNELKTAHGIYTVKRLGSYAGKREPPLGVVLINEHSREVLFIGLTMGDLKNKWFWQNEKGEFTGKPARIWYAESRAKERPLPEWPLIYQLEVDGKLIYTLEEANRIAQNKNEDKREVLVFMFVMSAFLCGGIGYSIYREKVKKLVGRE